MKNDLCVWGKRKNGGFLVQKKVAINQAISIVEIGVVEYVQVGFGKVVGKQEDWGLKNTVLNDITFMKKSA